MRGELGAKLFLMRLRPLLLAGTVRLSPRNDKTKLFMLAKGLRATDLLSFLEELTEKDYEWGPEADRDNPKNPGNVMLFLPKWGGDTLYVKLKIWTNGQIDFGEIMSFHPEGS